MNFGLELPGRNASWSFEASGIRIRYRTNWRSHALLREFGEIFVPDEALAGASLGSGRKPTLTLRLRTGAEPIRSLAAAGLPLAAEPYRLVLTSDQAELAAYYLSEVENRVAAQPDAEQPASRYLVRLQSPPYTTKGYDGTASFDGQVLTLRWSAFASKSKREVGLATYPVSMLRRVEWHNPTDGSYGFLRVTPSESVTDSRPKPAQDLAAVVLYGPNAGLAVACAIQMALPERSVVELGEAAPLAVSASPQAARDSTEAAEVDVDEILETIRKLGELRDAGLLTEDEFEAKKTELLGRI
ncbi:DUF4429 domain-containing protein [Actinoalloteichus hymeniacidonis]|uniref:DUF4429 domain-containing protein n=1 Tax=Actinoalloteichus hymeniacidonis TaxID=340345 RepID=UPI00155FFDEE|nr:DUF4429 domain-containing protein [Actinoalloteichus hymeniacidonis]MBB5907564.1 hypothetical protein [Actinoalloteichus hymeniacidonis]